MSTAIHMCASGPCQRTMRWFSIDPLATTAQLTWWCSKALLIFLKQTCVFTVLWLHAPIHASVIKRLISQPHTIPHQPLPCKRKQLSHNNNRMYHLWRLWKATLMHRPSEQPERSNNSNNKKRKITPLGWRKRFMEFRLGLMALCLTSSGTWCNWTLMKRTQGLAVERCYWRACRLAQTRWERLQPQALLPQQTAEQWNTIRETPMASYAERHDNKYKFVFTMEEVEATAVQQQQQ